MTLLGLPDAAHECSTILPNLDTVYKSTLYSVPKDLNFKSNIELRIHEVLCLQQSRFSFISLFAKLRQANAGFLMVCLYIRPSVRIEQLGSRRTNFHEIWY